MKKVICDKCGKTYEVSQSIFNSAKIVNFYICPACEDSTELEDTTGEFYKFCKLQGSRKQIEWAISIRTKTVKKFGKSNKINDTKKAWGNIETQASASWWIENRNNTLTAIQY